jgi:hypothetical protein
MTDPDIAVCLEILECTNADDLDGILERCNEDVVCEPFLAQVEGAPYVGHEGMRRWWEERSEAWEKIRIEPGEIERLGNHVLMRRGVFHTKARGSGVEISVPFAQGAEVKNGKVSWWGVYSTEQEALDRLRERDPSL